MAIINKIDDIIDEIANSIYNNCETAFLSIKTGDSICNNYWINSFINKLSFYYGDQNFINSTYISYNFIVPTKITKDIQVDDYYNNKS